MKKASLNLFIFSETWQSCSNGRLLIYYTLAAIVGTPVVTFSTCSEWLYQTNLASYQHACYLAQETRSGVVCIANLRHIFSGDVLVLIRFRWNKIYQFHYRPISVSSRGKMTAGFDWARFTEKFVNFSMKLVRKYTQQYTQLNEEKLLFRFLTFNGVFGKNDWLMEM